MNLKNLHCEECEVDYMIETHTDYSPDFCPFCGQDIEHGYAEDEDEDEE
jgi:hypothetical protein